jgi:ABC-2 type transport system permease protein
MSPRRTFALAWRLFLQVLRDRRQLVLIFAVPVVLMQLVSWVVRGSTSEPLPIALVTEGPSDLQRPEIEDALAPPQAEPVGEGEVRFAVVDAPAEGARTALRDGSLAAVITFPSSFVPNRLTGRPGLILVDVEGAEPGQVLRVQQGLQQSLPRLLTAMPVSLPADCPSPCADALNLLPPDVEIRRMQGTSLQIMDWYLPAIVPYLAFFFGFLMTSLSFLRERSGGTLERLLVSPLTRVELVFGYFGGFLAFSMLQAVVIIGYALFVLDVPAVGGVWPVVALMMLTLLTAEGFGIFFSAFANNEFQVTQFIPIYVLPQLFVCGIVWKIEDLPGFLQPFAYLWPMTYAAQAAREVMVRGDLHAGFVQMGWLSVFLLISVVMSVAAVRRSIS